MAGGKWRVAHGVWQMASQSIFAPLGDDHELTQEYRPQRAMLLF